MNYEDYIKCSDIAQELNMAPRLVVELAKSFKFNGVRVRTEGYKGSKYLCYTKLQYETLTGKAVKPIRDYVNNFSRKPAQTTENRERGLYNRITEYGGLLKWEI